MIEVIGYALNSIAFDPDANVRLYRLIVTLNLTLRDVRRNEVLFEQRGFQERADSREESALRGAAVDIARTVVNLAIERF